MHRREDNFTDSLRPNVPGDMIDRNPGVGCVWYTDSYKVFYDVQRRPLITIGEATRRPTWWAEGRPATHAEVEASIASGLPILSDMAAKESTDDRRAAAGAELQRRATIARSYYPRP